MEWCIRYSKIEANWGSKKITLAEEVSIQQREKNVSVDYKDLLRPNMSGT